MFTHLQHWRFIVYMRRRKGVEIGDARNGGGRRLNVIYISIGMSPFLGQNCMAGRRLMQPGNNIYLALNFTMFKLSRFSHVFRREAPYVNH